MTVNIGEFELNLSGPPLKDPHCIAFLNPWLNSGNVSDHILKRFSDRYHVEHVGGLREPGRFYDFTRYKPLLTYSKGARSYKLPNTSVFVHRSNESTGNDLVLLHMLEPHAFGERFNHEVVQLLTYLKIKRYTLTGAMYDLVPHTRVLPVSAAVNNWEMPKELENNGVVAPSYQGPTSIASMIGHKLATEMKLPTMSLIVHLPAYYRNDNHHMGITRLLSVLSALYPALEPNESDKSLSTQMRTAIDTEVEDNSRLNELVGRLETKYDSSQLGDKDGPSVPPLSPEMEDFLTEITSDTSDA